MTHLKWPLLLIVILLFPFALVRSQASRVAVVDFEKAVAEPAEGKKSSERFNATLQSKQAEAEKRQKELEDAQEKLQTQGAAMSETTKGNLHKDTSRRPIKLQRCNSDVYEELQSKR